MSGLDLEFWDWVTFAALFVVLGVVALISIVLVLGLPRTDRDYPQRKVNANGIPPEKRAYRLLGSERRPSEITGTRRAQQNALKGRMDSFRKL
jgi:hypothetical protein